MPNQAAVEALSASSRPPGATAGGNGSSDVAEARQPAGEEPGGNAIQPDRNSLLRYGLTRLLDERGEIRPLEAVEEEMIRFAVEHCHGQIGEVARRLGMGRSTLYRKLRTYRIGDGGASLTRDAWTK